MRSTPIYEVHAVKYAHLPRKAWEVQINPDPHDADFPMDYFVWVAIPLDEQGHRAIGGKPIVIDTGFNAQVGKKRGREVKTNPADLIERLGWRSPAKGLSRPGVEGVSDGCDFFSAPS